MNQHLRDSIPADSPSPLREEDGPWSIFLIFLRLGLSSFGGPVAHLGYFRDEFVVRRRWLDERGYADLVALCQFLPGPASSQAGMALGMLRAGHRGALAAWAGFTLPSAALLILLALGLVDNAHRLAPGLLHGLKVAAVAVVAQAVWGMGRALCTDAPRRSLMVAATCAALWAPTPWMQVGIIVVAALAGLLLFADNDHRAAEPAPAAASPFRRRSALLWLALFLILLFGLPLLPGQIMAVIDAFYRTGALVFGGGHVVLPLLQAEVVPRGWVDNEIFLAGYGAAQAVPGPLFTFAAFLGASMPQVLSGWIGGLVAVVAIFLPSFLLLAAALPFWDDLRRDLRMRAALSGINAGVVGLLLAALYDPVWRSAIHRPADFGLALLALLALSTWKVPPWLVVAACAVLGMMLAGS